MTNDYDKKIIAFDFDGTLANTKPLFLDLLLDLQDKYSYKKSNKTKEYYDNLISNGDLKDFIKELRIPINKFFGFSRDFRSEFKRRINTCDLFSGIEELLNSVSKEKNNKLLIVSSNNKELIENFFEEKEIKNFFDKLYCGNFSCAKSKLLKKAVSENGMYVKQIPFWDTSKMIYIGDESNDIVSCNKLGIPIISVTWGYQNKDHLKKFPYDYIANKPKEIEEILDEIEF